MTAVLVNCSTFTFKMQSAATSVQIERDSISSSSMASLNHKQNEIFFFKILLKSSLQLIRIPRKFSSKYGFNLPNPVFLKPPDGTEWKIFWTKSKSDGDIWFQNGWEEFVRHYSLERGYLVLFKYVESSHFDVLLFDKTTLQIEYPSRVPSNEKPNLDDDQFSESEKPQFSNDPVEILSEKPQFTDVLDENMSEKSQFNDDSLETLSEKSQFIDESFEILSEKSQFSNDSVEVLGEKPQFSDNSVESLSEKLPHFKTKMESPLLSPRSQKKLKVGTNGDLEPRSSLKRNHLHAQTEGRQSQRRKLEKSINGDARVKSTKRELEEDMGGNVFTNKKCPNSEHKTRMQPLTFSEKTEALKRAETFRSKKPFFTVIMQRSYVSNNYLHIPSKFANEHIQNNKGTVILKVLEGRTWSATYNYDKILFGWHKFASDNDLKVGDACVFEMTNSIELSFKVSIYRAHEDPSCSFSQGGKSTQKISKSLLKQGAQRVLEKVKKFESENPHFTVRITPCLLRHSKPYVPKDFFQNCTTERKKSILIQVGERQWHAKLIRDLQQEVSSTRFSAGWAAFARENNLKIGDACIFELIKRVDTVLDAHIFRCNS